MEPFDEKPRFDGILTKFRNLFKSKLGLKERTLTDLVRAQWRDRVLSKLKPKADRKFHLDGLNEAVLASEAAAGTELSPDRKDYLPPLVLFLCVCFIAFLCADFAGILVDSLIPVAPREVGVDQTGSNRAVHALQDYEVVITRNLFNSKGLIPGEDKQEDTIDQMNNPVKTGLPLNLVGTVILRNELRSIGTIQDTSDQGVYPVRVDDEIPGKLRVISVEPYRVVFLNLGNRRREYVEIPANLSDTKTITLGSTRAVAPGIAQAAPNQYTVSKSKIDAALANFNLILTQAKALPHFENGTPAGYKLIQIEPGSIYAELGLKNGDILCGFNGEQINDPARALEMYNLLKTSSHVEICIKRDGRTRTVAYDIQ